MRQEPVGGRRHEPQLPLHHEPPLTPAGVLLRWRWPVLFVALAFVTLAIAAGVRNGRVLARVDGPVTRTVTSWRSGLLDEVVRTVSGLGGLTVVVALLVVMLVLVWHECRALAVTLLIASAARPLLEWTLKEIVDRQRPDIDRLVAGNGPSFPSGHVMAAVAVWGLLPPVVALLSGRHRAWWWSVAVSTIVVASVAFSRIYLGVHWFTDVLGALLLGALYLLAVEYLLEWHHRRRPCAPLEVAFAAVHDE